MRPISLFIAVAGMLAALPAAAQRDHAACARRWNFSPEYCIVGTVSDGATGQRVPRHGEVSAADSAVAWAHEGCFALRGVAPGPGRVRMRVSVRGYLPLDTTVVLGGGARDTVHLFLRAAAPPCCHLDGEWVGWMVIDSTGADRRDAIGSRAEGVFVFHDSLPGMGRNRSPDTRNLQLGRFAFDWYVLYRRPPPPRPEREPDAADLGFGELFREMEGEVHAGDSVAIVLIPSVSHSDVALRGRIAGDSVTGEWRSMSARGRFGMRRRPPTAATDSLVARAWWALAAREAALEPPTPRPKRCPPRTDSGASLPGRPR